MYLSQDPEVEDLSPSCDVYHIQKGFLLLWKIGQPQYLQAPTRVEYISARSTVPEKDLSWNVRCARIIQAIMSTDGRVDIRGPQIASRWKSGTAVLVQCSERSLISIQASKY